MTEEGDALQRSLDAVDRYRKLTFLGLIGLGVLLVLSFVYIHHTVGRDQAAAVLAHYFLLLIWVTVLALVVVYQISAMTRRILRAIELASRR